MGARAPKSWEGDPDITGAEDPEEEEEDDEDTDGADAAEPPASLPPRGTAVPPPPPPPPPRGSAVPTGVPSGRCAQAGGAASSIAVASATVANS